MNSVKAFILTAECSDNKGSCGLKYYCISDTGPVLIVIDNHKPLFFIKSSIPSVFTENTERKKTKNLLISAEILLMLSIIRLLIIYFNHKRYLKENSITLYESDIRAEDRYLMERFINGSVMINGKEIDQGGFRVYKKSCIKKRRRLQT